ncbi:MAG TPA: tRNA (cytidine(34)-2'-O)-methyltransferase [Polyangiaceae bacterium]|nr:tRNA (cytidine(34)-2'-O)-methyltransferase [Polyangiaceae bacterium]
MKGSDAPAPRLRSGAGQRPFHVLLVEPEIPPNTGNIARLCAATRARLHLIEPLGFRIDEHAVRRAGLDYWHLVDLHTHPSYAAARATLLRDEPATRFWLFTGKATRSYLQVGFRPGDALVFGKESCGLPDELLAAHPEELVGIPTLGAVRSLNLANAVAIALYEGLRQIGELDNATLG